MERAPRSEKTAVVEEVRERLDDAEAIFVTEYRGLDVKSMADLRSGLREAGATYKVYKNTLARLAAREAGLADLEDLLVGPVALAFAGDDVAKTAKALREFVGSNPNLVIKGGVMSGAMLSADDVQALADLPSREELLAKFAGGLQAPTQKMASLMNNTVAKFAYGLQALVTERESAEAA